MKHFTVLHNILSKNSFSPECTGKSLIRTFSILLLGFVSVTALYAQRPFETIVVSGTFANNNIIIPADNSKDYVLTGTTTVNTVTISSGYKGTITLRDLKITSSKTGKTAASANNRGTSTDASCITVVGEYDRSNLDPVTRVNIILEGNNELTYTTNHYCAFQVNQGSQIHINAIDPDNKDSGKLTATNSLKAGSSAGGGAAIGAPNFYNVTTGNRDNVGQGRSTIIYPSGSNAPHRTNTAGGNVIIGSGTVVAKGGHGAGIGGGWWTWYNGIIIVYGGDVTSTAGYHAAGIGSGCPEGAGVKTSYYAENSAIIALPPSDISATGAPATSTNKLAGARNVIYMNDPNTSTITVRTQDNEKNADIYIDMSEAMANDNTKLEDLLNDLGITYDLKKVRVGRTDGTTGLYTFNGEFKDPTTFFTDASSSHPDYEGRPYMPEVVNSITGSSSNRVEVVLKRLDMNISFTDYPSTPLEEGYTALEARQNAHTIMMEYNDQEPMTNLEFRLQGGGVDFETMIFLGADRTTPVNPPTQLNQGDKYFIVLPLKEHKLIGIYSDVLLIGGSWGTIPLPGYIRRIGEQRVVKNDTGVNEHIKVTASPVKFVDNTFPATRTVDLTLNINHGTTGVNYDPLDVKAKYLISTEPRYEDALAANPNINTWKSFTIPASNGVNSVTTVSFSDIPSKGIYYIHWYVTSGVVYAHSEDISDPLKNNGAFGPYIIVDVLNAGTIKGNPSVCKDQIPSEIKGEASTGGSGSYSYQWQISSDGTNWSNIILNSAGQNYTPVALTTSPTYFQRITTDTHGSTATSNAFIIYIVPDNTTFYWKQGAANNDWNDPANWVNANGIPLNMIPVACSNVYIPGGATNYPSLHPDKTPVDVCGEPVCDNITFEYGGELAYQHKLTYGKAYIQYNWGFYGNLSGVNHGQQPSGNACGSAPVKKRDIWYALAAPLKSMATGDFAFAGYPLTWQAGFSLLHPVTGEKGSEIEVGDFSKNFSTNDTPLTETNNAIAVKVALYQNTLGCNDHCNLEGLRGVIEIPYFENATVSDHYPGHIYDRFAQESKFFYFNPQTLQLLHSPIGRMKRGDEAYRFVYEEGGVAPNIDVAGIPSTVPGYKQKVKRQNNLSMKVMVGNPFMASINAKQFFNVNRDNLEESAGYQLFNSEDQTWRHHEFATAGKIPPLQAFIVTLKYNEVNLLFPLEGTHAVTGLALSGISPGSPQGRSLYLKSSNNQDLEGDYSILGISGSDEVMGNVKKMIYSQGHATPETFFIAPDNRDYNLIQMYEKGVREIGIGVKSSDTKSLLSLTFENVTGFCAANNLYPVLLDRHLGIEQNLTSNNTYYFNQRQIDSESKYIDADRFVLQLLSSDEIQSKKDSGNIIIIYNDKKIEVRSSRNIKQVQIYDILSHQVYSEANINTNYYAKSLSLNHGVYLVRVYTESGESKVEKIMVY